MLNAIPLTVIPLILYNLIGYGIGTADPWASQIFSLTMLSGLAWTADLGDFMIVLAIVLLFFEVMRAARLPAGAISNHVLSTIVLIVYVVEFIVAGAAAHSVFFILTLIALFDVVAGFSITMRTAPRDISLDETIDAAF